MKMNDRKPATQYSRIGTGRVLIVVLSLFCFALFCKPGLSEAAPISVINQFSTTPCATGTGNMTCTSPTISAGSNRVLVLVVTGEAGGNHNPANTSATYGTAAFTEVQNSYGNNNNRRYTWMGYINESQISGNPGSNISITATSSAAWVGTEAYYAVYSNVDQISPLSGAVKADSPNTTTTVGMGPITTVLGGVAIYSVSANATAGNTTVPTGYTEHVDQADASNNYFSTIGSLSNVPGTSESITMTAVNARWTAAFMSLAPAPAGSPGNLQFSASSYGVNEDVGNVTITVTRTGGSSGAASVNYATSNGSALQPGDYTSVSGVLSWADGDTADKTFSVAIINDVIVESAETLNLILSGASGSSLGTPATATITINDNDVATPPGITVLPTGGLTTTEAGGSAQFTIVLDSAPTATVSIGLSSTDTSEGTVSPASVLFTTGNWATAQSVTVTGVDDAIVDGNISYTIATAAATSTDGNYSGIDAPDVSVTNFDNDVATPGTLQLSSSSYTVDESAGTIAITVMRVGGSAGAASVSFATNDASAVQPGDYTPTSGTLNWANGDAADKIVTISINNDAIAEGNEAFNLTLSGAIGASLGSPNAATVTIPYNDGAPAPVPAGNWLTFLFVFAGMAIYWIISRRDLSR